MTDRFTIDAARPGRDLGWLLLVALLVIGAGIRLRDPWPTDEPRFALLSKYILDSGEWLFLRRGDELYSDKPPVFMWLQAVAIALAGSVRAGFLLPSLLASLGTLALVYDLGRRLWTHRVGMVAAWLLLFALQFTFQANAMARSQQAGQNPLFMGEAGLWNGILIVKMPKPIRFYAGDSLRWCASYTSETETATDLVPAAFSTTHAVDRAILLGGQALAEAWGKHTKSGFPFFFSEKELDHGDKLELLLGAINGRSKIRFEIDHGDSKQFTDHGVIAIDTAVKLPA